MKVKSVLDEEEPVFSSLLQVNNRLLPQAELLMSFMKLAVGWCSRCEAQGT